MKKIMTIIMIIMILTSSVFAEDNNSSKKKSYTGNVVGDFGIRFLRETVAPVGIFMIWWDVNEKEEERKKKNFSEER